MKRALILCFLLAGSSGGYAADSMLRIACDGDNVGAEVTVNGKFKGDCPLDMQVAEGTVKLRVQKKVDAQRERVFEQEFRIGDGVVKKIEVKLGAPQLNAEGKRRDEQLVQGVRKLAEAGDTKAMIELASRHKQGAGVPYSQEQSEQWLSRAADKGDIKAMLLLATAYSQAYGAGAASKKQDAVKWYQRAAEAGDITAMIELGKRSFFSNNPDDNVARMWFRKAAEAGNAEAMFLFSLALASGKAQPEEMPLSIAWLTKAAEAGDVDAMVSLGTRYATGAALPKNEERAIHWWRKAADGKVPNPEAIAELKKRGLY